MQTFYLTDAGKVRDHNEDNVLIVKNANDEYLMAVADGMGGHLAGELASSLAIDYLREKWAVLDSVGEKADAVNWIRNHIQEVNKEIIRTASKNEDSKGMGSTLVVSILTDNFLLFGNIGDSSGYVLKEDKLYKVTKDHTLVNLLVATGELTEEEAKLHPRKNVLMKALGANNPAEVDIFDVDMGVKAVLLCSDGLTNMLTDAQIEKVLNNENWSIEEKIMRLIKKSNIRGGTDNISIAYLIRESGE